MRPVVFALLTALTFAIPAAAQPDTPSVSSDTPRVSLNAAVGPSFANVGTTFSATTALDVKLNDRTSLVGEFGMMARAPFREASEIAAPVSGSSDARVNAYHWNGNLRVRPFEYRGFAPYVTGGLGSFMADTVVNDVVVGPTRLEERRTATDFATNVGAGFNYRLTDWVGVGADYRTFFVHRDDSTPRVHRFSTGLTFSLK
jgi:opacity protein-like surface antigen